MISLDAIDRRILERLARHPLTVGEIAAEFAISQPGISKHVRVLEACVAHAPDAGVVVVGSADAYGIVDEGEVPVHEDRPLRPVNPYAASKAAAETAALAYARAAKLRTICTRSFNHTGPGQEGRFAVPGFANQLAEIEAGQREPVLRVGNLDGWRGFTDVRDMVRAYRLAILAGTPGEVYNLGRGSSVRIADVVAALIGLCRVPARAETDPRLVRPADVPRQEANTTKFRALTGWEPVIPWHDTLRQTLEYWRERIASRPLSTASPRPTPGA